MLFNSYIFILLFLPLCLIGWFGLNSMKMYSIAQMFLLGMSLWFYGYFNINYLLIIVISIIFNYSIARLMTKTPNAVLKKIQLIFAVLLNLGVLFYYKYFDFFISNVNSLFSKEYNLLHIVLPLGISFFTFQQVSYVVDAYRGEIENCNFLEYACFVVYFPQLIAGPIVSHDELIPQFMDKSKKKICWDNMAKGIYIFVLGLAKKVLVADMFGKVVDFGYADVRSLDSLSSILVILAYTFQVYFDFSGYCDMAIGLGKMMNIDLPVNFDSPYKALTITEFWNRWHKTLTRFFTKYLYIPMGGNRKGKIRTYINVMTVFLVSGLWHGASWSFVLWGGLHGIFMVVTRHKKQWFEKLHPVFSWLILFVFLNVTWTIFRADRLSDVYFLLKNVVGFQGGIIAQEIFDAFNLIELKFVIGLVTKRKLLDGFPGLMTLCVYSLTLLMVLGSKNAYERMRTMKYNLATAAMTAMLLMWCVLSLAGVSTFLYFNF